MFSFQNQVIFVLQILTEKEFHRQTPIVVLFDVSIKFIKLKSFDPKIDEINDKNINIQSLLPPLDCLQMVYNKMLAIIS